MDLNPINQNLSEKKVPQITKICSASCSAQPGICRNKQQQKKTRNVLNEKDKRKGNHYKHKKRTDLDCRVNTMMP